MGGLNSNKTHHNFTCKMSQLILEKVNPSYLGKSIGRRCRGGRKVSLYLSVRSPPGKGELDLQRWFGVRRLLGSTSKPKINTRLEPKLRRSAAKEPSAESTTGRICGKALYTYRVIGRTAKREE
ncbi:unnamed protein product [Euphydryas editha]|uniref:Ribosomal protein L15 n=1 Tax=Euphydryas editha TaxID=104508 RepID=A0AAU9UYY2_EUPED|nr:unnamed protein product [Euphydryas editha]